MCAALASRGHHVEVLTTNVDGRGTLSVPVGIPVEAERGVEFTYYRVQWPRGYKMSSSLARALWRRASEFDVVHVHSLYLWHGLAAGVAARRLGIPYVIRPHGTLDPFHVARHRIRKAVYWQLVESRNVSHAAGVHFTSEMEAEHARAAGLRCRAFVVPLGIDVDSCNQSADGLALSSTYPQLAGKTLVTFIGRLTAKKGLDLLLDAFRSAANGKRDAHLLVAGPDDEGLAVALRRQASELGIGERLTVLGFVSAVEKAALLRHTRVFALPSADENFALGVAEAMAAGVPVLITDRVGIHAEIAEAEAGIVVPRSVEALTAGLARLLEDADAAARLGANGRALAGDRYSWTRVAADLEDMYLSVKGDGLARG
jgi:glycosyltransferase involved in cell wall biosynthesis